MREARVSLQASLPAVVASILKVASAAQEQCERYCRQTEHNADELVAVQRASGGTFDFDSADGRFVCYWLLMGTAWPLKRTAGHPLASAMGRVFDDCALQRRDLHLIANTWLSWSESRLRLLGQSYQVALGSMVLAT